MKEIRARKNFSTSQNDYIKGDVVEGLTYNQIIKLNEKGFIEPLNYEDLILIKRELGNKKIKEEK